MSSHHDSHRSDSNKSGKLFEPLEPRLLFNATPYANDDTASVVLGQSVLIDPRLNDSDADGDTLSVVDFPIPPGSGTAVIENGLVRYAPTLGITGVDPFVYRITDGKGGFDTATIRVTITSAPPANQPPVATNDSATITQGQSVLINVLANDSDPNSDPLTLTAITTPPPANAGTAAIENNQLRFTPTSTFTGNVVIGYQVSDGKGGTATATAAITVNATPPANQPPVATNDSATTTQGQSVLINVLANDSDPNSDPLTLSAITTQPASGTAVIENNQLRYTPTTTFTGNVVIGYQISDGRGGTATATATVTVNPTPPGPNTTPYANDDTATVNLGQSVLIDPTLNDTDANGDPLTVSAIPTPPGSGTAVIENGKIRYTPTLGITGIDPFVYQVSDGRGGFDTATIRVTINPAAPSNPGTLQLTTSTANVNEHDGTLTLTVTRTGGSDGTVTVAYATANLIATAGQDFTTTTGTLTFAPGVTQQTITVPITDDPALEGDETFRVTLTNPTGGAALGATTSTTITIKSNDGTPGGRRILVLGSSSVEGNATRNSFRRPLDSLLRSAGYNVNFIGTKNQNSGSTPPTPDFDRDHEGYGGYRADEVLNGRTGQLSLAARLAGNSADGDALTPDIAVLYVGHNDIFQGQTPQNVIDDLAAIISVLRSDNPGVTIVLGQLAPSAWDNGIHNDAIAELNLLMTSLATSLDNATSRVVAVDLNSGFDTTVYTTDGQHPNPAGEAFIADRLADTIKKAIDGTLPAPPRPGTLALESSTYSVNENGGTVTVAVVRTGGSDGTVTIDYATVEGSATAGTDYTPTSGTVSLAPGVTRATFTIPVANDSLVEGNETFGVSLNRVTGGADLAQPRTATITINDDDSAGPVIGTGDGLKGEYYNNINFTGTKVTRVDPNINFNWGTGAPVSGFGADTFSVTWTGQIQAQHSELYTFTTTSDDGIRLWINGQLIIDQWNDHAPTNHTGAYGMVAGQKVDIRIDYYENGGGAVAQLRWASASTPQQVVPTNQLYSTGYTGQTDSPALLQPQVVWSGLTQPTALSFTSNGLAFIAQKNGIVRIAREGSLITTPFIDIRSQVNDVRDRGMLGMAVHPSFPTTPYVYLLFTYDPPETVGRTGLGGPDGAGARGSRLIRVTADAANGYTTAVPGSEVVLLGTNSTWQYFGAPTSAQSINNPYGGVNPDGSYVRDSIPIDSESHTIGALAFMPDGSLLVTSGDGTSYGAVDPKTKRVQDLDSLNGKLLRIDPITGQGLPSNPFYNGDPDANRSKVYALGFRNPFRLAVDPVSGTAYVGDVGWNSWEEINRIVPGGNYGWPWYEGGNGTSLTTPGYRDLADAAAFYNSGTPVVAPVWARSHSSGGVAIVAGDFNTGSAYGTALAGALLVSDYGVPAVDALLFNPDGSLRTVTRVASSVGVLVELTQGPDGAMYYVDITGKVGRLVLA